MAVALFAEIHVRDFLLRSILVALWIIVALLVALGMVVYVGFDNVTGF